MADSSRPWSGPSSTIAGHLSLLVTLPPPLRSAIGLAVSWGGAALIGSWLAFYFIALTPGLEMEAFRATVLLHLATGAVLAPYLGYTFLRGRLPGGSPLDWPIAFVIGAYGLTTATSLAWRVSLEFLLLALMAVAVFAVLSDARIFRRWQVEAGLMLGAGSAAGYGLWVAAHDYANWLRLAQAVQGGLSWSDLIPPTVPRIHDVSDFVTILGMVLAMAFPFYLTACLRSGAIRLAGVLGSLVMLLALFLTLARGAWVGAALGSAVTLGGAFWLTEGGRRVRRLLREEVASGWRRWLLAGVVGGGVAALVAAGLVVASWETRPGWLFRASATPRWEVLEEGAAFIRDDPLLGTGPGAYGLLYNAHNGYVQAVVDMGVLGALAALALAGTMGWLLVRSLRRAGPSTRLALLGAAGGLTALAAHSLVDTPNLWKSSLVGMAALAAVAVQGWREVEAQHPIAPARWSGWSARVMGQAPRALLALALVGLLVAWARLDLAHYHYNQGVNLANHQLWERALQEARESVRLDPDLAIYPLQLGQVEVQAYQQVNDPALLRSGIAHLHRAVELEPRGGLGYANLAIALSLDGDREGARQAALAAIDRADAFLDESDVSLLLAAGTVLEENGWGEEALQAYSSVLTIDARLADSPFWSATEFRRQSFGEIVGGSVLIFDSCRMLWLHLRSDNEALKAIVAPFDEALSGCQAQVSRNPDWLASRVILAEGLLAQGDEEGAFSRLSAVVRHQSDFGPAHTALGRWYAAQGRLAEARTEWLEAGQLRQPEALILLGDSYPPEQVPRQVISRLRAQQYLLAGEVQRHSLAVLYYRMMFGRVSPWVMLLPGGWQEAVPARYVQAQEALARWEGATGGQ